MLSLKKEDDIGETARTYLRMFQLLLQSIGLHAVEAEPDEYELFRSRIDRLQAKVTGKAPLAEALSAVGDAAQAMHEHGVRASEFIRAQHLELQMLLRLLTRTMADLGPAAALMAELRNINRRINKASTLEEIRDLKSAIAASLVSQKAEIRQDRENARPYAGAGSLMENRRTNVPDAMQLPLFPAVFPVRGDGEFAIRNAPQDGRHLFVAVFMVDRLDYIASHFGRAVGDRIVTSFGQKLTSELTSQDRLFRWSDSSFIALIEGCETKDDVHRQIERVLAQRLTGTFTIDERPVVLPISASWTVVPIAEAGPDAVIGRLDSFVIENTR